MRIKLLLFEVTRFLVISTVVGFLAYAALSVGIWLYDSIHVGRCMLGFSLSGYCVIDSFLLAIIAGLGLGGARYLLAYGLAFVLTFLGNSWKILTLSNAELLESLQPPPVPLSCEKCGASYAMKSSFYQRGDTSPVVCMNCFNALNEADRKSIRASAG